MNDDEIWDLARKPVTEFVESIKQMNLSVEKLVKFYLDHKQEQSNETSQARHSDLGGGSLNHDKHALSPLACAKLELAIVFAVNTCYWMYLVTQGQDPSKNEISKDIERIRLFMNRAKEVEDTLFGSCSSVKRPKIDKEASKRLCLNLIM